MIFCATVVTDTWSPFLVATWSVIAVVCNDVPVILIAISIAVLFLVAVYT